MKIIQLSDPIQLFDAPVVLDDPRDMEIHLFTQFFIHPMHLRHQEIKHCLYHNCNNPLITHIHLLNERLYNATEMGMIQIPGKVVQNVIGHRLRFDDIFAYIRTHNLRGYFVMANSDILFDKSLADLRRTSLHQTKSALFQLRYEYQGAGSVMENAPIFGPRFDSQDTWILHSNFTVEKYQEKALHIEFGKPGCDNKMVYLFLVLGYHLYNHPEMIKTYHNHQSQVRNYSAQDVIGDPWGVLCPFGFPSAALPPSLGINLQHIYQTLWFSDNRKLGTYVAQCILDKRPFVIPRIAGIENNVAVFTGMNSPGTYTYVQQILPAMKNNAGILMSNQSSVAMYSYMYLQAFRNCEMMFGWDVQGNYLPHIAQSHEMMKKVFHNKQMIWSLCLDIFHYILDQPWTWALKGQRILIISPFEDSILEKIPIRHLLWGESGVDLFPDCTFVTLKPPMTQADEPSREFWQELETFWVQLDQVRDQYDVALVSAGGYGNLICNYIFERHKRSSVYVGGVLQMYFGILGSRWLKERPDILRIYMNEHWSRPKSNERPKGCDKIEGACYW